MRGLLHIVVFVFLGIAYIDVLINIYEFFRIIATGEVLEINNSFSGLFLLPIILYIVVFFFRLKSLVPALHLSISMYFITEFSLLILQYGFLKNGSSLISQSVFLILGLIFMIGARWALSSIYYNKYEREK